MMEIDLYILLYLSLAACQQVESACNYICHRCNERLNTCTECKYDWYGTDCMFKCQNCWVSGCNSFGICGQCTPGRYGDDCASLCPVNCGNDGYGRVLCRREDGTCLDGCKLGWWGDTCNRQCNQHCDDVNCLQHNDNCIGDCKIGWWGLKCDRECPDGCKNKKCSFNGKCTGGCREGLTGARCLELPKCKTGMLRKGNENMSVKCNGCQVGWTSDLCDEKCPGTCQECDQSSQECFQCPSGLYGLDCSLECGLDCRNSDCDMQGTCTEGCRDGLTGPTCQHLCPQHCLTCLQDEVICLQCKTGWGGKTCETYNSRDVELEVEGFTGGTTQQHVTLTTVILPLMACVFQGD